MDGVGVAGVGGGMAGMQHSLSVMDSMSDAASEREDDSGIESSAPDPQDNTVFIRIGVPELKVQVRVASIRRLRWRFPVSF